MPRHKLDRPNYRLRPRGRIWAIDYTDPVTGRTRRVSTGEEDRGRAEIWRDQWVAGQEQPEPPPQPNLDEIMDGYLAARRQHVASYQTLLFAAKAIKRHVGNLQPHMLSRRAYIDRRSRDGVADGTIRREITALRAAVTWATRERWISEAPYIDMPASPPPREMWLTREQIDRLINAASSPHVRLYIVLGYHTGARRGAILDLTWDRVDLDRRVISYNKPGRGVNRKRRATVPINMAALAELQMAKLVAVSEHVIEFRGKPVSSIKTGFTAACERAGIPECTPHILRHSAATHLVMARVSMVDIARMLGDTVATIERVYGKHSPDFLRSAADALAGKISVTLSDKR